MSNNDAFQLNEVFNVKGKIALVTGGGSGIGLMVSDREYCRGWDTDSHKGAQALAVNGAKVYIVGRTEEKLQNAKETHGKDIAGELIPLVADINTKEGVKYVPPS